MIMRMIIISSIIIVVVFIVKVMVIVIVIAVSGHGARVRVRDTASEVKGQAVRSQKSGVRVNVSGRLRVSVSGS